MASRKSTSKEGAFREREWEPFFQKDKAQSD